MPHRQGVSIAGLAMMFLLSCSSPPEEVVVEEVISVAKAQDTLKQHDQALRDLDVNKLAQLYHPNMSVTTTPCGRNPVLFSRNNLNQMLQLVSYAEVYKIDRKVTDASASISGDKAIISSDVKAYLKLKFENRRHEVNGRAEEIIHIKDFNGKYVISSIQSQDVCP